MECVVTRTIIARIWLKIHAEFLKSCTKKVRISMTEMTKLG